LAYASFLPKGKRLRAGERQARREHSN
jgi:hypothetical protein